LLTSKKLPTKVIRKQERLLYYITIHVDTSLLIIATDHDHSILILWSTCTSDMTCLIPTFHHGFIFFRILFLIVLSTRNNHGTDIIFYCLELMIGIHQIMLPMDFLMQNGVVLLQVCHIKLQLSNTSPGFCLLFQRLILELLPKTYVALQSLYL
jgi:hypothetical protein